MTPPRVSAIVLAAGESRRMGTPKPLLPLHGTTLLGYQLEQLASIEATGEIIVVTGHRAEDIEAVVRGRAKARAVRNAGYASGKASSVRCGAAAVAPYAAAIMLCAVDQPRPASVLRRLVEEHASGGAPITLPVHGGRRGHPLVFARALLPELLAADDATLGVRAILDRHAADVREVAFADPVVLVDINTPEDAKAYAAP
jgi:molybdenum cofactor cytidylyltransferase